MRRNAAGYDAVVVGGDLNGGGGPGFGEEFLVAAASAKKKALYVPGNWDSPEWRTPDGVVPIHSSSTVLGTYSVGGLGGSNTTPFNTRFELQDDEAGAILGKLGPVDVLVSHSPPANTKCDLVGRKHVGSMPVRRYVEANGPVMVLSGHVHESRAIDKVGYTTVVNPGPLKDGNYAEISLGAIVTVELKSTRLKP